MSWEYRVTRTTDTDGSHDFGIREVYYDDSDRITGWTEKTVGISGTNALMLDRDLERYKAALGKPVLAIEADGLYDLGLMGDGSTRRRVWKPADGNQASTQSSGDCRGSAAQKSHSHREDSSTPSETGNPCGRKWLPDPSDDEVIAEIVVKDGQVHTRKPASETVEQQRKALSDGLLYWLPPGSHKMAMVDIDALILAVQSSRQTHTEEEKNEEKDFGSASAPRRSIDDPV